MRIKLYSLFLALALIGACRADDTTVSANVNVGVDLGVDLGDTLNTVLTDLGQTLGGTVDDVSQLLDGLLTDLAAILANFLGGQNGKSTQSGQPIQTGQPGFPSWYYNQPRWSPNGWNQGNAVHKSFLRYLIQSERNQYLVVSTFFNYGDANGSGQLCINEFSNAYSSFLQFILGRPVWGDLLAARFKLADLIFSTDSIDLSEFTLLIALDLKFIYQNYDLMTSDSGTLSQSVATIDNFLASLTFEQVLGITFFGADFNKDAVLTQKEFRQGFKLLGYVIGIDLSYTGEALNDLFTIADANNNWIVCFPELLQFVVNHAQDIIVMLNAIANNS